LDNAPDQAKYRKLAGNGMAAIGTGTRESRHWFGLNAVRRHRPVLLLQVWPERTESQHIFKP
jgi:hypothetical protein